MSCSRLFRALWPSLLHNYNKRKQKIAPFRHCNTATKSLLAEPLLLHEFREKGSRPLLPFIRSADKHRWTDACIVQTSVKQRKRQLIFVSQRHRRTDINGFCCYQSITYDFITIPNRFIVISLFKSN